MMHPTKKKCWQFCRKLWNYFWKEDSIGSWVLNIIVAFLVIRYLVYPILGVVLGTSFPIVAVVSESMEHGLHQGVLCGKNLPEFKESFENYWQTCGNWYEQKGISAEQFRTFSFQDGFNKGDVIILWRANSRNIDLGDVLIFQAHRPQPIIHRVVGITEEAGKIYYQTKGDHNSDSIEGGLRETKIDESRLLGKGVIRIPYLGWLKILFVEAIKPLGIVIER